MVQFFSQNLGHQHNRLELWRSLQLLNRPEILRIIASGTADWPDAHFDYLVTELPEESLAGVFEDRALDADEAKQVLESAASALVVMHDRQFVHGSVEPSSIYAVGDAIKLSAATVQRSGAPDILVEPSAYQAPEVSSSVSSPAADIWSLGATVFYALTRQLPADDFLARSAAFPAPLPEIFKRTLDPIPAKRWTARQILETLSAKVPERPPVLESLPTPPAPVQVALPLPIEPKRRFVFPYAIAAIVLFLALLWLIFGPKKQPSNPVVANVQPTPVQTPAPAQQASQVPIPSPPPPVVKRRSQPILQKENVPVRTSANATTGPVNWRVIAYTYNRESEAEHKAATVNRAHPNLHAEVFSPQPGRYLVSIGDWMPMDEARHMRTEAISEGLPHDTYAQNFHR